MRATDSFVLSIGGIDPSAGAGVFSDIKTFEHLSLNGLAVSTCLSYQNHEELLGIKWFSLQEIVNQLEPLFSSYHISVCKIGIVENWQMLNELVDFLLAKNPKIKIVLDPVLVSSSGYSICPVPDEHLRDEVLSKIYLITPNRDEFIRLGFEVDAKTQESHIYYKSVEGHAEGTDMLIKKTGEKTLFAMSKKGSEKHGSGCVYSSSLAGFLSMGESIDVACSMAKNTIEKYLSSNTNLIGTLNT